MSKNSKFFTICRISVKKTLILSETRAILHANCIFKIEMIELMPTERLWKDWSQQRGDNLKSRLTMILMVLFIFQVTQFSFAQDGMEVPVEKVDLVLLMDTSGSMNTTDPNDLIKDAEKLFVDLSTLANVDLRLGFVGYSDRITASHALVGIEDANGLASLKAVIDQVRYQGSTDLSVGLNGAATLFIDQPERKRIVILLSDGVAYSDDKDDLQKTVLQQLDQAMQVINEKGIIVDTVAVKQSVASQSNLLFGLSDQTGGTIYTALEDTDVAEVYDQLAIKYYNPNRLFRAPVSLNKGMQQLPLALPTNAFSDVLIVLETNSSIKNIKIFSQAEKLRIIEEPHYALVEMAGAKQETFSLQVNSKNATEGSISIYLKNPITQTLTTTSEVVEVKTNPRQMENLTIQLSEGAKFLTNHSYVNAMSPVFVLIEEHTGQETLIPATFEGDTIIASHQFSQFGKYQLTTILNGPGASLHSNTVELLVEDQVTPVLAKLKGERDQKIMLALSGAVCLVLLIFVIKLTRRTKAQIMAKEEDAKRLYFAGRLSGYIINTQNEDDDVPPITEYLHRHLEKSLTLADIVQGAQIDCDLKGAENIIFRPGPKNSLIIRNNSNCTIIKSHEIVERNKEALVEYDEKMYITFEDQLYEMEIYYKNSKT